MVTKKSRRLIGNVTVWGGLGWLSYINLVTYLDTHAMLPLDAGYSLVAIAAVIFGMLWGLRG
jgi:hypothetical protein